jgi:hypothetical protein
MKDKNNRIEPQKWDKDARVAEALKERQPIDVMLFSCPDCGSQNYYNGGSHASCHVCKTSYSIVCDDEDPDDYDGPCLFPGSGDDFFTVADAIDAETAAELDGPR